MKKAKIKTTNSKLSITATGDLTRKTGILLKRVKELQNKGYYKFVREREVKILIRMSKEQPTIRIRSIQDVMQIISQME